MVKKSKPKFTCEYCGKEFAYYHSYIKHLNQMIVRQGVKKLDIHARCRSCIKYGIDCVPPHDIDTYNCQSYSDEINPSRRNK